MDRKQKCSLFVATVMPLLAVSAYFLLAPAKVNAFAGCPSGQTYTPSPSGYCSSGSGANYRVGSTSGVYVFCGGTGQGTCVSTGCVQCAQ